MNRLKKYMSLMLPFMLIFTLFGCSADVDKADSFAIKQGDGSTDVMLEVSDTSLYCDTTGFKELVRVSKSDMSALCFSEDSLAVSVYDSGSQKVWRSLPEIYNGERAAAITLKLLVNGNEYILDSQSHSEISYDIAEDSILIKYAFEKSFSDGTDVSITVPVLYRAADGTMSVSIDCPSIDTSGTDDGVVLCSVSVLPYLGASAEGQAGDFILIPDGSGAVIDTAELRGNKSEYTVKVYSSDPATGEVSGASAAIPAFGMKVGDGAFVAVIDEGDAMASIKAHSASVEGGFNRVYAEFEITPVSTTDDGYRVSGVQYEGQIKLSYRFISKENTDYTGMAAVCRELLIRNGSLTTGNIDSSEGYPFNLSLIGAVSSEAYTDFAQCYDILTALAGKGINNINLRYRGILSGGLQRKSGTETDFDSALDKDTKADELGEFASSQGTQIYIDADIFTFADVPEDRSLDLSGNTIEAVDSSSEKVSYCSVKAISENVNALLYAYLDSDFGGICLDDAGYGLYSDFSQGEVRLRDNTRQVLHEQANAISATKKLMVANGNLYAIKYADVIVCLADEACYGSDEFCTQVPFVQAVLHGICDYSLSPINLSEDTTEAFLRAVEYGAVPYYEWYHEDEGTGEKADSRYYLNGIAAAQQQYELAKNTFSDLRDAKITSHSEAAENVYLTVYDNETEIYVNYGDEDVTVSGVTVEAKSFIRVN